MSRLSRMVNVFRSSAVDRGVEDEMTFHIECRIANLVASGMTRDAAEAMARRQFGNRLRLREESRDVKLLPWLDSLVGDARLAPRMLRKHAMVIGAAIVSLAMALGGCLAAFMLIDALILKPLPVRQPQQLVYLTVPNTNADAPVNDSFNDPTFVRLRDAGRGRVDLFAVRYPERSSVTFDLTSGERERVRSQFISGDAFDRLGVGSAAGRLFDVEDDRQSGTHPVAVLSHAFWMRRFGGDPAVVGRWFVWHEREQDRQFQILGVAERGFSGVEPGRPTDVWLPYAMQDPHALGNDGFNTLRVMGRMKEDVPLEQVQSVLQVTFTNLRRESAPSHLDPRTTADDVARFINTPLHVQSGAAGPSRLRVQFQRPLSILAAIAALVVLIAGSNVANLFLARATAREREMSLRLCLGAGRGRLIQQLLIESALVAGAACLIGMLFAAFAAPAIVGMLTSADDPISLDLRPDWRVVTVLIGLTVSITVLFGLIPALRASRVAPMTALRVGGRGLSARLDAVRPFIAIQVGFSLVVLFVGGLLVMSFVRLSRVNPGFATSDVLQLSWEAMQHEEPNQQRAVLRQVLDRLRQIPGVEAVSAADFGGVLGRTWRQNIALPGTAHEWIEATVVPVTPGFLETMKIMPLAGRTFVPADLDIEHPTILIVSESFAKRYFGGGPAVGRRFDPGLDKQRSMYEVVGMVADVRYDLRKPPAPALYVLMSGYNIGTLYARVAGDRTAIASRLRQELRATTPLLRVTSVTSQAATVNRTLVRERLLALLAGFFALVGLMLTAVGLYGVLSYAVVQRTREIGIRVALGARALGAVRSVLGDIVGATLLGAACGLGGGLYASRFVKTMLFDVAALEFSSLALPLGTLLLAALAAAAVPAWRAARVDPVIALRNE
jgi:putative ABC transport system permease protein